jgi:hypothetical protein
VDIGVGQTAQNAAYTRRCADCLGWSFEQVSGDPSLLRDLLAGRWDERRFLVVPPHHLIRFTVADSVIEAVAPMAKGLPVQPALPADR